MYVDLPDNAVVGDRVTVTMTNTGISTGIKSTPFTANLTVTAQNLVSGKVPFTVAGTNFSKSATTEFTASLVDAAGNVSALGSAVPAAPIVKVALVNDDLTAFFSDDGQIVPDATRAEFQESPELYDYATTDRTLTFQGNANANDTVYLYENGVRLGVATKLAVSDQGVQAWSFDGTFGVGNRTITAKSVNAAGVVSDESVVFTFSIQKEVNITALSGLPSAGYSAQNTVPERLTLQAQDVLDLNRPLSVQGDVSDTLVISGADNLSAFFGEAPQSISSPHVQRVPAANGQSGAWQFDLDGSGSMDLLVSDTIHRIILSA